MSDQPLYAIYGHHKCATMWLQGIARRICRSLGLEFGVVYDEFQFEHDLPGYVAAHGVEFLLYGSADIRYAGTLPPHRGVHIVRDPRDIVVSAYYSHLHSHSTQDWKELIAHREKLQGLDKDQGLAEEIRFRERSFRHIESWDYGQEHVLEIRFEDVVRSGYETMLAAFGHLGLVAEPEVYTRGNRLAFLGRDALNHLHARSRGRFPLRYRARQIPAPELLAVVWHQRFQRRAAGRRRGSEDVKSHYRKGQPGDWTNHFSNDHRALFKSLYPGLVPKLGYAANDDW